ncbi:MAG: TrkH family potassium uptake protein [Bacteroidales bacterium]
MRPFVVARYVGLALLFNALLMLLSAGISLIYHDVSLFSLLLSSIITGLLGVFPLIFVQSEVEISTREGYLIVVLAWIMSCTLGMLPYILYGQPFTVINAWFESVSGYTTTGATTLIDIELLPKGLLFWRSATHFLGGIGVVLFTLLMLPSIGTAKVRISRSQLGAFKMEDAKYSMQQIIRIIFSVYIGLNILCAGALWIAGMELFDAINHAFSTISTGGFSTKNSSIMSFNSPLIETIIIIFMLLASINFGLLYTSIVKKTSSLFNSLVVRYFIISLLIGIIFTTIDLILSKQYTLPLSAFRHATFQLTAQATTTGFASCSNATWSPFAMMLTFFFMLQCGCIGSTAGGIKIDRILIFYKAFIAQIRKTLHPHAIIPVRLKGVMLDQELVAATGLFIGIYIFALFITTALLSITGQDLLTAFSASLGCLSNVGPGFGDVYSLGNYDNFSGLAKFICTLTMMIGRLEIYGFIMLIFYRYWK